MCSFVFMKISKLFHWLYASVMMLPLVVAPIFAIFMHRHQVPNYEVVYDTTETTYTADISYTYKYDTPNISSENDLQLDKVYHADYFYFDDLIDYNFDFHILYCENLSFSYRSNEYSSASFNLNIDEYAFNLLDSTLRLSVDADYVYFYISNPNIYYVFEYDLTSEDVIPYFEFNDVDFYISSGLSDFKNNNGTYDTIYSQSTFNIITGASADIIPVSTGTQITYADTDIGSQFIYSIYLPLNKYFNVTSFLGLNSLYSWINTNVFNGVAPLGFNIFYMLLSYWLLVSIFWLVFDLVMYVPNLAHRWLDKGSLQ